MRANLFKLANVGRLLTFGSHQRPELFYLIALDVEHACAFWRVKPLVQTRAEIVALQIVSFEIKLAKRMRAVNNRFDSFSAGHLTNGFDGSDLTRDVDLMRNQNQARAIGYSFFKCRGNFIKVLRRNRNLNQLEFQTFASFAL